MWFPRLRFVQPGKIIIDANERAVTKTSNCFFVCISYDSFLMDLIDKTYSQRQGIKLSYLEQVWIIDSLFLKSSSGNRIENFFNLTLYENTHFFNHQGKPNSKYDINNNILRGW